MAAASSVLLAQLLANPVDVVAQRLMIAGQLTSTAPQPSHPSTAPATMAPVAGGAPAASAASLPPQPPPSGRLTAGLVLRNLVADRGVLRGLYSGYFVSCTQFIPSASLWWSAYPQFKAMYGRALGMAEPGAAKPAPVVEEVEGGPTSWRDYLPPVRRLAEVLAGSTASFTVAVLMCPLDVIRTRAQVEGLRARTVATTLLAAEGLGGLWRGVGARIVMLVPQGAISVWIYEYVKRVALLPEFAGGGGEEAM